eukprot:4752649-Pyramimonas_sp.AAC.1
METGPNNALGLTRLLRPHNFGLAGAEAGVGVDKGESGSRSLNSHAQDALRPEKNAHVPTGKEGLLVASGGIVGLGVDPGFYP